MEKYLAAVHLKTKTRAFLSKAISRVSSVSCKNRNAHPVFTATATHAISHQAQGWFGRGYSFGVKWRGSPKKARCKAMKLFRREAEIGLLLLS
jgi:hypothetical protein